MRRALSWGLPLVSLLLATPAARPQEAEDPLVDRVRRAIDSGVTYLRGQQRNGNWEVEAEKVGYPGGLTGLAVLALLTSGVPANDEAVQKGLEYLRGVDSDRTYVVSLQVMALAQAGRPSDKERIQHLVDWLLSARSPSGWSYTRMSRDVADNSNTQYALLALHEGLRAGAKVDRRVLDEIQRKLISTQDRLSGGWHYRPDGSGAMMNMTTAGLCDLVITGMDLAESRQDLDVKTGIARNCGEYRENAPVSRALAYLGDHFPRQLTLQKAAELFRGSVPAPFYGLYGIERAGRFTGQRYLGGQDWYEVGCRCLVDSQKADGSWDASNLGTPTIDGRPLIATSFALLFLSKGRTPVLVSKLAYGEADYTGWNNKRNDVRNLVEFCSRELFRRRPLAWQAFDVRTKEASTREEQRELAAALLQSPVVFFNGHDWAPRGKEEGILREYLANGGFVFAEACCGRDEFDRDFRALMKRIFPASELTPVPPDHPVWTASGRLKVDPDSWPLEGIQHGCKWVVMYSRKPLAGYWEADLHERDPGRTAFKVGANVIAYATGLEAPRPRLTQVEIADDRRERVRRNYLKVAQLRHDGDWQPAPKAMHNLMAELRRSGLDVMLEPTPVYATAEKVLDYWFFYMHGRRSFTDYGPNDLRSLRFRLKTGGVLLADACCGSKDFDAAFRRFVETLFADDKLKLQPIPPGDELYGKDLNGEALTAVRCRRERPGSTGDPGYRVVIPALEGVKYRGRWVVVYSRYDIGCALEERHTSTDCLGYDHDSAVRLARAAVLYALAR
jgi:hypothetical protein